MILVRILHRLLSKYLTTTLSTFILSIHYMAAYFCCDEFEKSYMHDKLVFLKKTTFTKSANQKYGATPVQIFACYLEVLRSFTLFMN